ncbi:MAG: hypothetical protein WDZ49_01520 [Litorilinea sp.]
MDQDVYRIEDEAQRLRNLSPREQRRARRNRVAAFVLTFAAVVIGATAGWVWINQMGFPGPDADQLAVETTATPPAVQEGVVDAAATEDIAEDNTDNIADGVTDAEISELADAEITDAEITDVVADGGFEGTLHNALANRGQAMGAATSAARIEAVLAAREPTPTATPLPAVASRDAVVARGGADLWRADDHVFLTHLAQGVLFQVEARSADGAWLLGTTPDGESGWVALEDVIAFDTERLRTQTATILPMTPTPVVAQVLFPTATPGASGASGGDVSLTVPQMSAPEKGEEAAVAGPIARINLVDARLNVRAGPGAQHIIVTKAHPDEQFAVMGQSAQGEWVQLAITDVAGGFGWAATEYVDIRGTLADVPVSNAVSNAPVYVEGAESERVSQQRAGAYQAAPASPAAYHPVVHADPAPAAPAVHTGGQSSGLSGKLAIQATWGGDIYLYEFATGNLRLLTGGFDPAFSPDGTQVAFTRAGGEHGLYLINSDGTNERMIFNGRELLRSPKWSPDGNWIVFERADEFTDCRHVPRCPSDQQPRPGYPEGIFRQPMLSRVDVNGQNYRDLGVLQSARAPDWSDNGIVYASAAGIQLTKDKPDFVTTEVFFQIQKQYEMDPALQPGGNTVVFQRREASHWEIYRVDLDGGNLRALTRPEFTLVRQLPANVATDWSPDGRHIVFLSNRQPNHEAGDWAIWVMDADGSNQRKLDIDLPFTFTYTYVGEQMLSWSR